MNGRTEKRLVRFIHPKMALVPSRISIGRCRSSRLSFSLASHTPPMRFFISPADAFLLDSPVVPPRNRPPGGWRERKGSGDIFNYKPEVAALPRANYSPSTAKYFRRVIGRHPYPRLPPPPRPFPPPPPSRILHGDEFAELARVFAILSMPSSREGFFLFFPFLFRIWNWGGFAARSFAFQFNGINFNIFRRWTKLQGGGNEIEESSSVFLLLLK